MDSPACPLCGEPARPAGTLMAALAVLFAAILIYYLARGVRPREAFTTQRAREVYSASRQLFDRTQGGGTYSEFRTLVGQADPVTYTDVRALWKKGGLTPEAVQQVL
jgi:hypothetical protein